MKYFKLKSLKKLNHKDKKSNLWLAGYEAGFEVAYKIGYNKAIEDVKGMLEKCETKNATDADTGIQ